MASVDEFLQALSSGDPVPGGGSVAALTVAIGASLLRMVCELTLGRDKFAGVAGDVERIAQEAGVVRDRARALVDEDAGAFAAVARAMKLPRGSEDEKAVRREAVQEALKAAVEPPLQTMNLARQGLDLALRLVPIGNPSAVSDVGSAAVSLDAGFCAARLNVDINLASIRDHEFIRRTRRREPDSERITAAREAIMAAVSDAIGAPD